MWLKFPYKKIGMRTSMAILRPLVKVATAWGNLVSSNMATGNFEAEDILDYNISGGTNQ